MSQYHFGLIVDTPGYLEHYLDIWVYQLKMTYWTNKPTSLDHYLHRVLNGVVN